MADLEQEWNKTQLKEQPEDGITYEYYMIGDFKPVRVKLSPRGFEIGAESIDIHTGQLKRDNALLMRIATSWEVEEIDRTRFEELCDELRKKLLQKKKNNEPGISSLP